MIEFVDTHAHLYDEAFDADFEQTIARIKEHGVVKCIFPAIDSTSYSRQTDAAALCGDFVSQAMGLHPTSVAGNWRDELQFALDALSRGGYVAVGEIGIDGYWSKEFIQEQKEVFRVQLEEAYKRNLPVIIHAREATEEIFQVLESLGKRVPRGVFHAFSGSYETYERICKYGDFMVGIGGVVTYKNAGVAKSIERIPLERIVVETDSPYLTPVPYRGKRNESSYLVHIPDKIAQVKGCTVEEVAAKTTGNAFALFGL